MKEYTIYHPIGKIFAIPAFEEIEDVLRNVIEIGPEYILQAEPNSMKGTLLKYGLLDLTFRKEGYNDLIKVFAKSKHIGYVNLSKEEQAESNDLSQYVIRNFPVVNEFFPIKMEIIDCCQTDDESVWAEKYFYV